MSSPGADGLSQTTPPHDAQAERAVLGSMLLSAEAVTKAGEALRSLDFYRPRHQIIFEALLALADRGEPADVVTIQAGLEQKGKLEEAGGMEYIADLFNAVPTPANVDHYARIVRRKALLRQLIDAGHDILGAAHADDQTIEEILDRAEAKIFAVTHMRDSRPYLPLKEVILETMSQVETLYDRKALVTGVPSGLRDLDKITAGFQKSDLVVLASRPSMGKTALALNFALHAALNERIPSLIFSLEMSRTQLGLRMLSMEARVDGLKLRTGYFEEAYWGRLTQAASQLGTAPIYIDDTSSVSLREIRSKARRLSSEVELGLIVVDYLQLMEVHDRNPESRQQEISILSRGLKLLARELSVPVLALSQLSRKVEDRTDKRPILSDLRESGAIEQDADVVIFIFREDRYKPNTERQGIADLIVAKQRNGPLGTIETSFQDSFGLFRDLAREG